MKRIVVVGGYGAGKSVFAERLGELTGIPVHHLDILFWQDEAARADRNKWLDVIDSISSGPSWIIDGNYGATVDLRLRRADTVVYFDFPPVICMLNVLKRAALSRLGIERRPDIVSGCNERLDLQFFRYVWTFNQKHRKGLLKGIEGYPNLRSVIIRNRREAEEFLAHVKSGPGPQ